MYLFLNAVIQDGVIILFDEKRSIVDKEKLSILLNESSKLIPIIDNFVKKNNLTYKDIENIVVVNGPGSFTGVRTISLVVNTLSYIFGNMYITPVSYFDLFENYPIVKNSSKRDLFVKKSKQDIIEIVSNEDFSKYLINSGIKKVFGEKPSFDTLTNFEDGINYENIIKSIDLKKEKQIEAYYVKKPSIT